MASAAQLAARKKFIAMVKAKSKKKGATGKTTAKKKPAFLTKKKSTKGKKK